MTSGGITGTSGRRILRIGPWGLIAVITIPVVLVNATSDLIEMQRAALSFHPAEPFVWEFTSVVMLLLMAPLVGQAVRRWPLSGQRLPVSVLIHAVMTVPFSLAHVAGMVPLRQLAYQLYGRRYDFFGDQFWLTLIYEWRKDVLTYAVFAGTYVLFAWLAARQVAPPASPERLEIRNGGRTLFLMPSEILCLEAAGNYVTLRTVAGDHLLRATLTDWARRLSAADTGRTNENNSAQSRTGGDFVRIHRSRIVNRQHIREVRPTASGDFELTLSDGSTLTGSRRFRSALG